MKVLTIGEILWDIVGSDYYLGGAPFNFAYHCAALGADSQIISCVGDDDLGREAIDRARSLGVRTNLIQKARQHPTGTVKVTIGIGEPRYEIRKDVAWDHITLDPGAMEYIANCDILCFGTLAQRNEVSRDAIVVAASSVKQEALVFCDINLRQDFFSAEVIIQSLKLCNGLKLNRDEMLRLSAILSLPQDVNEAAAKLIEMFKLHVVVMTCGSDGAKAWTAERSASAPGLLVQVADTVGCGDAFGAAFAMRFFGGENLESALQFANAAGAYVASQKGATPPVSASRVRELLSHAVTAFDNRQ